MDDAPPPIFDRRLIRLRRELTSQEFANADFLHVRAMDDVVDRLETVKRKFPAALFFGAGALTDRLTQACGIGEIFHGDAASGRLPSQGMRAVYEEDLPPLAPQRFDLIVSLLALHTANDLIGALIQYRQALKPDGLFIAAVFGETSLSQLKVSLLTAESECQAGAGRRVAPFATIQDFGQALARAGFALPVTDIDKVRVQYKNMKNLIEDLRAMGETAAFTDRAKPLTRDVVARATTLFSQYADESYDILYLTGWAPHENQQKPLRPGAGATRLEDAIQNSSKLARADCTKSG